MKLINIDSEIDLKNQFSNEELFLLFKIQIHKDFSLTGIELDSNFIALYPNNVYHYLKEEISHLIDHDFNKLLNLLYRIDIPENKITNCFKNKENTYNIYDNITFLILKRIWMKIWYRFNY